MRSILLVDDKQSVLDELTAALTPVFASDQVEIRHWVPTESERDAHAAFTSKIDKETTLVITDADLTSQGQLGLFGASVVAWCQQLAIPVGDYSRNLASLPKAPELFELRVPSDPPLAASFIAATFRGFRDISDALASNDALFAKRSPAAVLAALLGQPEIESQLALYAVRLGAASGALVDRVEEHDPSVEYKRALLGYIAGHLLLNVLRFPGPILSLSGLKAYVASDEAGADDVTALFGAARYKGPFADLDQYFWLSGVDEVLDQLVKSLPADFKTETSGEMHRAGLEKALDRQLARHACPTRCQGQNGGFFCPFTTRTVCQRSDCSVGSNSWIPQGAKLCRIERDFFEEWAPILGL
ncbi:MAG TPA: hypothetical protein VF883_11150 [Thermoanaerobaculia bacterium]|jgi:hypothetical protein